MRRTIIASAALMAAAACADLYEPEPAFTPGAQESDSVTTPGWAERAPSAQDILRVYPASALRQEIAGLVYLDCTVEQERKLDCVVGNDLVPGYGFGEAALKVADLFVVKRDFPGAGPGARVRVPVRFVISD